MSDVDALERRFEGLQSDVRGLRSDMKDVAVALRDLVHVDKKVIDHEKRLRALEISQAGNTKSVNLFDWLVRYGAATVIGGVITFAFMASGGAG